MGEGLGDYTEFQLDGQSIAGGMDMNPMVPAEVPSYWMVYFGADDVDKAHKKAIDLGGKEMLGPQDFPGGRFRSEEHTSELQSPCNLVCRLLLEKKKTH